MRNDAEQILPETDASDSVYLDWFEDSSHDLIHDSSEEMMQACETSNIVIPSSDDFDTIETNIERASDDISGYVWSHRISGQPCKRALDIIASTLLIACLSPLMLCAYLLVRMQDGGPGLYRQVRIGHGGKQFQCLKFRSMCVDADAQLETHLAAHTEAAREWEESRKLTDDPRVSRLGRFLRKSSIDELPQFFNVLAGDMSLVGPRPITAAELDRYDLQAIHYLRLRPGISGLWQVSGRSGTSYEHRVRLDREYSLHRTLLQDLKIMVMTIPAVIFSRGAI